MVAGGQGFSSSSARKTAGLVCGLPVDKRVVVAVAAAATAVVAAVVVE